MAEFSLDEVLKATGAELLCGGDHRFSSVSTDSRSAEPGALFVALKGENFDGGDFVIQALDKGASGALVSAERAIRWENYAAARERAGTRPIILALDPLKALGDLANFHRMRSLARVIAVAGSNGKTTVKEMVAHVMAGRYRTLKNPGNLNNLVGLPLTLLRISPGDEVAVVEMGMSARGELKRLCEIARPDAGVMTNVGPAHIELLGSFENIKLAKKELIDSMGPTGVVAVNADDPDLMEIAAGAKARVVKYGLGPLAEVRAEGVSQNGGGLPKFVMDCGRKSQPVSLNVIGRHNVYNALAAAAVAQCFGLGALEIKRGLESFKGVPMHMELKKLRGSISLIDDSYNANPVSMAAAAEALASMKASGRAFFLAGDMLELGDFSGDYHHELGGKVAGLGIDYFFALGDFSRLAVESARKCGMTADRARLCLDHLEMAALVARLLSPDDTVLVKGSRRMKMEKVGQYLARIKGVC